MNDLVQRISDALRTKRERKIRQFGDFTMIKELGQGQQGIAVLAESPNRKRFAIKLYAPRDKDPRITKDGKERFIREAKILLGLKHRNIVNVYVGGSARWHGSEHKWVVTADFAEPGDVPYYIMDYVEGKSVKSAFYKGFVKKLQKYKADFSKGTQQNLNLFEQLIVQASGAMAFFHGKGVIHRDIKPDNIIYSPQDNTFIIVDFGFAKPFRKGASESLQGVIRRKPYIDIESEQQGISDELVDQHHFASMLLEILEIFKSIYADRNYNGMRIVLEKAAAHPRKQRYMNISEFLKAMEPYLYLNPYRSYNFQMGTFLIPITRFGHFNAKLRIPFSGSIPLFQEMLNVIDTDDFQRLRGVCQLGPAHFVYPGAKHTRFEHSLGTYFLSLKYLEVLLKNPIFFEAIENVDEAIKLVVLGSLLHDIGHYPFSHWIEEMRGLRDELEFRRHEDRARNIVLGGKIGEIIKEQWEVDANLVCKLISGTELSPREELLRSIIDSVIDVDKIDYMQRDSAHCGVPYGVAFDVERLISSLWINKQRNKICLTEKGRSCFVALITSNIVMYQEVYWHKTVRACTAMFKRFLYESLLGEIVDAKRLKEEYLYYPDQRFVETLYAKAKRDEELSKLIKPFVNKGRTLYKPAYVHYHGLPLYIRHDSTKDFFNTLSKSNYPLQVEMVHCLVEELRPYIPQIKELDILLETTPVGYREAAPLIDFQFYDSKLGEYESLTPEIMSLNKYLDTYRRSYIFCKPEYYGKMRDLTKNGTLNKIYGMVVETVRNKNKT